ncbi:hypothetical protein COK02_18485 [Bacillus cereus]|nr:hypothetical protein COK02_18485 [Bacillus cereus]
MKPQSYEINVDTLKSISHSSMEFSQNNLNISELIFNITEDEKPLPLNDTDKIIVYFKKPDKTVVFQDKEIEMLDKSKGKIKVLLTSQTLVRAGDVQGEISIERVENGTKKRANTYGFSFKVRSSIASNESLESTNEFQVFDKIIKVGEKFEDFEEEDFDEIIAASAKADTALSKSTENTNQIGILSKTEKSNFQLTMNTLQPFLKKRKPIVSFLSDDGTTQEFSILKPLYDAKGIKATMAIVPTFIGTTGYITLDQLKQLHREGHDIASHTHTHPNMTTITDETILRNELKNSRDQLNAWGITDVESIVYPQGGWNENVLKIANEYYLNGVLAGTSKLNYPPIDTYKVNRVAMGSYFDPPNDGFTDTKTLAYYKYKVDKAIERSSWLIFMVHPGAYSGEHNAAQQQYMSDTIDYIKSKGVEILTIKDAYRRFSNPIDLVDYTPGKANKKIFRVGCDGTLDFTDKDLVTTKTKADMNIYVDGTNGDDTWNDGSQTKPYKTINKAISVIPKFIEHNVNVFVDGDFSATDLSVSSFMGNGMLIVQGNTTKVNIRNINARNNFVYVSIKNFAAHGKTDVRDCMNVDIDTVDDSDVTARVGVVYYRSNGRVVNCTLSNKSTAIQCEYGTVISNNNTGVANTQAFYANWGGRILKTGTSPAGPQSAANGGLVSP